MFTPKVYACIMSVIDPYENREQATTPNMAPAYVKVKASSEKRVGM